MLISDMALLLLDCTACDQGNAAVGAVTGAARDDVDVADAAGGATADAAGVSDQSHVATVTSNNGGRVSMVEPCREIVPPERLPPDT